MYELLHLLLALHTRGGTVALSSRSLHTRSGKSKANTHSVKSLSRVYELEYVDPSDCIAWRLKIAF